jgi:hypothetical protein
MMEIVNCLKTDNEHVTGKCINKDGKDNKSLNLNKDPQNIKYDNFVPEKYNPRFIMSLLMRKHLRGRVFFYFDGKTDFVTLCSDGQLNVRGCEDRLFKFWGNSEFRNIRPNTIFQKLEDKIIKINFTPFSGGRNLLFNSYATFLNWLEDNSGMPKS